MNIFEAVSKYPIQVSKTQILIYHFSYILMLVTPISDKHPRGGRPMSDSDEGRSRTYTGKMFQDIHRWNHQRDDR